MAVRTQKELGCQTASKIKTTIEWEKRKQTFNLLNPPANARDVGSIPGSGRSPVEGKGNPLPYSWLKKIPWTEERGGLQSMGPERVRHD